MPLTTSLIVYDESMNEWALRNGEIRVAVGFDPEGRYALKNLKAGGEDGGWFSGPAPLLEGAVEIDGARPALSGRTGDPAALVFHSYRISDDGDASTLAIEFRREGQILTHSLRIHPESPLLQSWVTVKTDARSRPVISRLKSFGCTFLNTDPGAECHTVSGIRGHLPYGDRIPHPSFRAETATIPEGKPVSIWSGGRSSELDLDWFALRLARGGGGVFGGFEWSGERKLDIQRRGESLMLEYGLDGFRHAMAPGETLSSPRAVIGVFSGEIEGSSIALARFARRRLQPPVPLDFPWVMYNTWFCLGVNQDEETMRREIDVCAEIGVEGVYLDAGWFARSPREENKYEFSGGLGYWKENRDKFPSGIRALSDYAHSKGLKFGLWVEPERVAENTRAAEPDGWTDPMLVEQDGKHVDPACRIPSYMLCLGCPESREWVLRSLNRMIEEYNIDWMKWDNNIWGRCTREDHGHQAGDGGWAHIQGLYDVLDRLRALHPTLVIENCASGGNRMDLGLLQRTHVFWIHDDSFTSHVNRFHIFGTSHAYPAHYLNSWVIDGGDFTREPQPMSERAVKDLFRSRFLGATGISLNVRDWSDDLKSSVRREIEFYKANRRFLFGDLHRLTPQTEIFNKTWEPPTGWEAFQLRLAETDESLLYCFRDVGDRREMAVIPREIHPARRYVVRFHDEGREATLNGSKILAGGLVVALPEKFSSAVVFLRPE